MALMPNGNFLQFVGGNCFDSSSDTFKVTQTIWQQTISVSTINSNRHRNGCIVTCQCDG